MSRSAFSALRHRDFRLFWTGQLVSLIGTWLQNVGQAWLVLTLTNSAFLLSLIGAAQFTPVLLLSLYAGVVIDRVSKRNLLLLTQTALLVLALVLAVLVSTGTVRYWHVLLLALLLGLVNAFDMPVRQSYVYELVGGRDDLMNAIALNSAIFNGARLVGPGVAGLVMATWGPAAAFYLNALSFLAVIGGLCLIPPSPPPEAGIRRRTLEHLREGLGYIWRERVVGAPLLLLGLLSLFAMNFNVLVPVYARYNLHQSARGFGFLMSSLGLGALAGSLTLAERAQRGPDRRLLLAAGLGLGLLQVVLSFVRSYWVAVIVLAMTGWMMLIFNASVNTTIQLTVPDALRGRVMSVYTLLLVGVTPFGALFAGSLCQWWGATTALRVGGGIGVAICLVAMVAYRLGASRRDRVTS
jgi:MFS family permease